MTRLVLVRHGATAWTGEGRLQGATDIDLSDDGIRDAERLATVVGAQNPGRAIVSPLARARSTERILRARTGEWPAPTVDDGWSEHGLGEWEGRTGAEVGDEYAMWRAGRMVPPGGEEAAAVRRRVRAAIDRATKAPGTVLVVTHGGVIRAALSVLVGLTADRIRPVDAPSVTLVDVAADGARLAAYNLTSSRAPGARYTARASRPTA